ncbi:unnamed protein product [Moneuplotes crassus]|uniref:Uncharacterized protein n=1 Tax=Euplotes crassus TaxID=5936 RepID=A0AAD1U4S8_EUPCR|nr:unnamed protein product [Moneuplotes crassus]
MSIIQQFDENLDEEILDEKVVPSRIKTSTQLVKNMSNNPFERKPQGSKLMKTSSCPVQKLQKYVHSYKDRMDRTNYSKISEVSCKENSHLKPSLQRDIKDLLQRAIRIRNSCKYSSERHIICEKIEDNSVDSPYICKREVTMEDISAPN